MSGQTGLFLAVLKIPAFLAKHLQSIVNERKTRPMCLISAAMMS